MIDQPASGVLTESTAGTDDDPFREHVLRAVETERQLDAIARLLWENGPMTADWDDRPPTWDEARNDPRHATLADGMIGVATLLWETPSDDRIRLFRLLAAGDDRAPSRVDSEAAIAALTEPERRFAGLIAELLRTAAMGNRRMAAVGVNVTWPHPETNRAPASPRASIEAVLDGAAFAEQVAIALTLLPAIFRTLLGRLLSGSPEDCDDGRVPRGHFQAPSMPASLAGYSFEPEPRSTTIHLRKPQE